MKFFLYVPGMAFDGNFFKKPGFSLGGSETMGYYVAKGLVAKGHQVFVFCNLPDSPAPREVKGVKYISIGKTSQQTPFGDNWERFAQSMPFDVLLGQRAPGLMAKPYNSKMNYFWTHDLALKRFQGHINAQLWNTNKILAVSEFHRKQICETYGVAEEFSGVLPNGIDLNLWDLKKANSAEDKKAGKIMFYSHRPERGLENLVKPGGIMEQLHKVDPEINLVVCGYDNTTQEMQGYYNHLYSLCDRLPNVRNVGYLSKDQLAQFQMNAWLHVYPTEFEETSCITVMEEQAAGTPVMATRVGALPETLKGAGVYWSELKDFVKNITYLSKNPGKWETIRNHCLNSAKRYDINSVVDGFEKMVLDDFGNLTKDKRKLYHHFIRTCNVYSAAKITGGTDLKEAKILESFKQFDTTDLNGTESFYEDVATKQAKEGVTHGLKNPGFHLNNLKMQPVLEKLVELPDGSKVLDYGCCIGQVTFAMAEKFKNLNFTGVDISKTNIDRAVEHLVKTGISNIDFVISEKPNVEEYSGFFDFIMCTDLLEHIWYTLPFLNSLVKLLKPNGKIILTTPMAPAADRDQWTQHLHAFEEEDIRDMVGHKPKFNIVYVEEKITKRGEHAGCHAWMWEEDFKEPIKEINYDRKLLVQKPKETISCCIILEKGSPTIEKTLRTIVSFADEVIIGVDDPEWFKNSEKHNGGTVCEIPLELQDLVRKYGTNVFPIESPLIQGFAAARNQTVERANGDWIFWIDDDEDLIWPERLYQYVRINQFDSYGIPQHHLSVDPIGVLKTDYPARLFRNNKGIKFFGVVHEHPETAINKGAGKMMLIPDKHGAIMHNAYDTEETRRERFVRNFPLMERDRQENPDRKLGMLLWLRDLAHKNRFEFEQTNRVSDQIQARAKEGVELWRKILDTPDTNTRMIKESMPYLTECVDLTMKGEGIFFKMALDVNTKGLGDDINAPIETAYIGKVETKEDLEKLYQLLVKEKIDSVEAINYI
jgi:glycosyltransferase involved in cell wall biosynthesis/2-polyprenyl-3-methyl-5-hydroxy-6-metoxy-1,4-benzoquinol methylase